MEAPLSHESKASNTTRTIGQIAYEGYLAASDGKSLVSGAELPPFDKLLGSIQAAWESAALAVAAHVGRADAR